MMYKALEPVAWVVWVEVQAQAEAQVEMALVVQEEVVLVVALEEAMEEEKEEVVVVEQMVMEKEVEVLLPRQGLLPALLPRFALRSR